MLEPLEVLGLENDAIPIVRRDLVTSSQVRLLEMLLTCGQNGLHREFPSVMTVDTALE